MKYWTLVLAMLVLTGCATHQSPTGRGQMLLFSSAEMSQMGAESFTAMKQQMKISQNQKQTQYVRCVANRITSVLPGQQPNWEVVLFDSEQVNAFALPGGHIGVYTGLLNVANTPDQLASVIGHEVAHVLANHGNEKVSRSQLTGTGLQIVDVALGVGEVGNKNLYMAALGLGTQVGIILPYGREQETEADVMGAELMAKAGFNPSASITLWQNMAKVGGEQGPELLSTHPSHNRRITELQQIQAQVRPLYDASEYRGKNSCKL